MELILFIILLLIRNLKIVGKLNSRASTKIKSNNFNKMKIKHENILVNCILIKSHYLVVCSELELVNPKDQIIVKKATVF